MSDKFPLDQIQAMINRLEDKVDQRFNRVDDRLEKLDDKIESVSKTTDRNTVVLEEHQRRALANEKHTQLLEEKLDLHRSELAATLKTHEEASVERAKELEGKQKELAESVELVTKLPKLLKKASKIAISIGGVGTFLWSLFRFLSRHVGQ